MVIIIAKNIYKKNSIYVKNQLLLMYCLQLCTLSEYIFIYNLEVRSPTRKQDLSLSNLVVRSLARKQEQLLQQFQTDTAKLKLVFPMLQKTISLNHQLLSATYMEGSIILFCALALDLTNNHGFGALGHWNQWIALSQEIALF